MPPQSNLAMFQTQPLPYGAQGEAITAPCKSRAQSNITCPHLTETLDDIGDYIARDVRLVRDLVWEDFVKDSRGQRDFSDIGGVEHPDCCLLRKSQHRGGDVVLSVHQWT